MTEKQQLYEGMYILNAALSDAARAAALQKLQEEIASQGGVIEKTLDWGRRRLAYEVEGKREGYYYLLYFRAPTPAMKELWHNYGLNPDLLRFMTMRTEKVLSEVKFKPLPGEL
ncbi:MAG: 30S ribosomal protein S6 [Parachlamydiales bacterium]